MSRTRTRAAVAVASATVAAAVVVGGVAGGPTGSTAYAAAPTECRAGDVAAAYRAVDAAMSHRFGRLTLTNTSGTACWVQGYGGLSYVGGGDGVQVGAPAERTPSATPRTVLQPGDRVASAVSAAVASVYPRRTCRPAPVDGFRVYLPDETHAIFVRHPTTGCRNPAVHLLQHKAYR